MKSAQLPEAVRLSVAVSLVALFLMPASLFAQLAPTSKPKVQPGKGAPAGAVQNDPKAVAVIDQYLESMGGRANLKLIKDRSAQFVNKKFSPTGVTEMKMVRLLKRPSEEGAPLKIREEWELPGLGLTKEPLHFVQVYDGEQGWVKTMGYVSPLGGRTLTVFVWDKPIDDFFMSWQDDGYTVKYLGPDTLDGVAVEKIQTISFAGKQRMQYLFNKEDGMLLKKEWSEAGVKGPVRKEVFFDEYIKIRYRDDPNKWVKFAINQKIFEGGELSLEKEYQKIVINGGVEASAFTRPDGPAFEERPKQPKAPAGNGPTSKPGGKPTSKPASKPKG